MYTHVLFKCVCTVVSPTHCIHENLCSNYWIKIHNQHLFKKEEKKKNTSTQISAIMFNVKGWWSWNSSHSESNCVHVGVGRILGSFQNKYKQF